MSRNRTTLAAAALAGALAAPIAVAAPAFAETTSFQGVSMMTSTEPRVTNPDGSLYTTPYTCQVPSGWEAPDAWATSPQSQEAQWVISPDEDSAFYCTGQAMTMGSYDAWVEWKNGKAMGGTKAAASALIDQTKDGNTRTFTFETNDGKVRQLVYKYDGHAVISADIVYPKSEASAWATYSIKDAVDFGKTGTSASSSPSTKPAPSTPAPVETKKPGRGVDAKTGVEDVTISPMAAVRLGLSALALSCAAVLS